MQTNPAVTPMPDSPPVEVPSQLLRSTAISRAG